MRHLEPLFEVTHNHWLIGFQIVISRLFHPMRPGLPALIEVHEVDVGKSSALRRRFIESVAEVVFRVEGAIVFGENQQLILARELDVEDVHVVP